MRKSNLIYAFPDHYNEAPGRIRSRTSMHADSCVALCCAVFLAGVLMGTFSVSFSKGTLRDYIAFLAKNELELQALGTAAVAFLRALLPKLLVLSQLLIASGCIFGAPICLIILAICGASSGICAGCVYHILGVKAFAFNLCVLFPPTLIFAFSCSMYAARALRTSVALFTVALQQKPSARLGNAMAKNKRALVTAAAAAVISAALESVLIRSFGEKFF